ncbi:MAG: fibronectin type III domain-containing protein [bacterium]|nr:fibronectin type III domain-containing protein [bacterium]
MDHKKILKITSIAIGTVIAILLLIVGFKVFSSVFTQASDTEPRDVVVSNMSENSVKISWSTDKDSQGLIEYGTSPTTLNFFAPEPQKIKIHSQDLTLLSPNTTYYFQIRIGDKKNDNGGVPWTFTTKGANTGDAGNAAVVSPVVIPTTSALPTARPTSQHLEIPVPTFTSECSGVDCTAIKNLIGKGCNTQDYFKCLGKATPTPKP